MASEKDKEKIIQEMMEQREITNDALKKLLDGIESERSKRDQKKVNKKRKSEKKQP